MKSKAINKTVVLILAGGELPDNQLGPAPLLHGHPLDLPAGSDLALQRIAAHYRKQQPEATLVAVMDQNKPNHYDCLKKLVDQCLAIPAQPSVCTSLSTALQQLQNQLVVVNPITCLPCTGPITATTVVIGETPLQRQNWSAFSHHNPDSRHQLLSKLEPANPKEPFSFPFTGLLAANRDVLLQVLNNLSNKQQNDLGWIAAWLLEQEDAQVLHAPWYDLGHRASYARSRRSQLVSRSHNQVSYDEMKDLIQKRSVDQVRLSGEAAYLTNLPIQIKRHFPALINYSTSEGLEIEYIPFPSLTELFLHWDIGPEGWLGIWNRLGYILNELRGHEKQTYADCNWLYSKKLQDRLDQLKQDPPNINWDSFWTAPLKLNGHTLLSPFECSALVQEALKNLEGECLLHRIHGDLCFNNILAEPLHASLRLIDPRGETAEKGDFQVGYGDPRYDLVKLLHSGCYYYDVIVHDLFELNGSPEASWKARLLIPRQAQTISEQLITFVRQRGLSSEEERWLTASLFFSMLPLHGDNIRRQQMLCFVGCCIVQDCFPILLP